MAKVGEVLVCELCGNEVTVTKEGGNPEIALLRSADEEKVAAGHEVRD